VYFVIKADLSEDYPINAIVRAKSIPQQIEELLCERIRQGVYLPEQRMPSEDSLAQELRVSRASVRAAMASLVAKGYVERKQGDGTYPVQRVFEIGLRAEKIWDIMRQIRESGRTAEMRILEQCLRPAREGEVKLLSLASKEEVLFLERLFLADGKPVALISNTIRVAGMSEKLPEDAARLSPLDFLARFHEQRPGTGTAYFNAVLADQKLAGLLQVEPGSALLKMSGVMLDESGAPLMAGTELYPGDEGFHMKAQLILP